MRFKKGFLTVWLLLLLAPDAGAEAVCTVDIHASGTGTARCVGSIGGWTVDPSPVPARFEPGHITFLPRRLISFDPYPTMTFSGRWTAIGPVLSGEGTIEGRRVPFIGDVRITSRGAQMELLLGRSNGEARDTRRRGRRKPSHDRSRSGLRPGGSARSPSG